MRWLGIVAALAALLGGLGGSGPAVQPSVAGPAAKVAAIAEKGPAAPAFASATPTENVVPSPAVWRSYAWQPWSYYDRYERRWDREAPRRGNGWSNRTRAWPSPQQVPRRYDWQGDRRRGSWGTDNSRARPRTWVRPSPRWAAPRKPAPRSWVWRNEGWRGEAWRRNFNGPWDGEQRWVDSRGSRWRHQ